MDDERWTGGGRENVAREALVRALPPDTGVLHTIDREKGDELRIEFPEGAFVVRATRLYLSWEPGPDVEVELRRRPIERQQWQTWTAIVALVYALVVLPPSILTAMGTVDRISGIGSGVTALLLAIALWWGRA